MRKRTATRSRVWKHTVKRRVTKKRGGVNPPSHHASSASSYHSAPPTYNETYVRLLAESPEIGTGMNRTLVSNMEIQKNSNSNSNSEKIKNLKSFNNSHAAKQIQNMGIQTNQTNDIEKLKVASNRWERHLRIRKADKNDEDSWSCKNNVPCLWLWKNQPDYYLLRNNKNGVWATTEHIVPIYKRKLRDWERFTGRHAQQHGWEEFIFHMSREDKVFPASVEKDGKHVYPDGTPLAWQDAQMLARQRWNAVTKKGTHEDLYNKFSEEFVIPKQNIVPGKWLGIYSPEHDVINYTAPEPFPFTFDMSDAMKRLQNMGSERLGDSIKWATTRIAKSTRDFITSLDEQILTMNYIWFYNSKGNQDFVSHGDLYIITRTRVYKSIIDFRYNSAGQTFTPLTFKDKYQFAEPLSAVLGSIFSSYCKEDINLFRDVHGTGHNKDDLKMHNIKLQSIINAIPYTGSLPWHILL